MKTITVKTLKNNPLVDVALLRESLRLSRKLTKAGIRTDRRYELPSPFDTKLTKVTIFELPQREEE